jgi:FAD:protein FMN transferase
MRPLRALLASILLVSAGGCERTTPSEITPEARATTQPTARPAPFTPQKVSLEDKAMGTHVLITTYTTRDLDEAAIRPKLRKAIDELRRLEALMTTWRDDSEISRINQAAGKRAVVVGPETLEVIQKSQWVADRSGGVFDISFEAMRDLWRFDENKVEEVPSREAIDEARALIEYRKIKVDERRATGWTGPRACSRPRASRRSSSRLAAISTCAARSRTGRLIASACATRAARGPAITSR